MRAVMQLRTLRRAAVVAVWCSLLARPSSAQQRDTTTPPRDSLKVYTLPPAVVSVTRANPPISKIPLAVHLVDKTEISRARPTWGLDEALVTVPGVHAANRYNFSLDQRISIRGFGARSQFAVRGIKVLVDGIPQTLPDGQGQLTNLELGAADRIEVLRGSSSALFGNASGGVISIWTDPVAPEGVAEDVRVLAGTFDRHLDRNWTKWQSSAAFRVGRGGGSGLVTVSQLDYTGQRQHSDADLRNFNSRWHFPLARGWSLTATADLGWDPRADNPGALTAAEMARNPDSAAAINITRVAGKNVTQGQGGVTVRRDFAGGGEAALTVFGFTRSLKNPTTFAYIDLDRVDYGTRLINAGNPDDSGDRMMRALSGSIGVAVTPSDALTLYGNIGTSFETPTTTELTNRPSGAGGFNPALDAQNATTYELGVRGDVAGRLNYSVALFTAAVRGELISYPVPADTTGRVYYQNAGRSRHRGVELGAELAIAAGLTLTTTWTYSDFRYLSYTAGATVLHGRALPGLPQPWPHFLLQAHPGFARRGWVEIEETHSSGYLVNDALSTSTLPWWTTNVRLGWNGTLGSLRCGPFVGFDNVFNRSYVGSVVINASGGRYYEPAPGRNVYVGFSLGAGQ